MEITVELQRENGGGPMIRERPSPTPMGWASENIGPDGLYGQPIGGNLLPY